MAAAAAAGDDPDDDRDWGITVTDEDKEVWAAQEALVDRLPQVCSVAQICVHSCEVHVPSQEKQR
jgi:hypothetical protein